VIQSTSNAIIISVRVIPRAGTSGVAGTRGEALLVRGDGRGAAGPSTH
jgi:hypothetical protein